MEIKILRRGEERILMNVAAEVFDNPIDALVHPHGQMKGARTVVGV